MTDKNKMMTVHGSVAEPWKVTLVDTGENTGTGGRLRRIAKYLQGEDTFCMTYGDGVADVDINASIDFHKKHGKAVTLTSVQPVARFGALGLKGSRRSTPSPGEAAATKAAGSTAASSCSRPKRHRDRHRRQFARCSSASRSRNWLVKQGEVHAFFHHGFWQAMDTLRDKLHLEVALGQAEKAPWKTW